MINYNAVTACTVSREPDLKKIHLCLLSIRHADVPESCVRYVGAIVDDVIKTGSEVMTNRYNSLNVAFS